MSKLNRLAPAAITLGQISFGIALGLSLGALLASPSKEQRMDDCWNLLVHTKLAAYSYLDDQPKESVQLYEPQKHKDLFHKAVAEIYEQPYESLQVVKSARAFLIASKPFNTCMGYPIE